jgi:hypothetical protein
VSGFSTRTKEKVVAAVVIPGEEPARTEALLLEFSWRWWTLFLLGVLAKAGGWTWFFGGEVVVD